MRIGVSAPTDSSDAPHIEKKNNKPKRARPAGGRRFSAASTVIAYEAMPSTNCQRHAGARKGQGTLAKLTKKKKNKTLHNFQPERKGISNQVCGSSLSRTTGSFFTAFLPHGGTEVFIRRCQGSKHQINGI